jgi:long-chain acyl-CoA synthetase
MVARACMDGIRIGYFSGDPLKLIEEVGILKPTIFVGVPRILLKIHQKITQGLASLGGCKKWLIDTAVASKMHYIENG